MSHSMKDAFIYWKQQKSGGWSWTFLGSSLNFRHKIWDDFETLGLFITFSKWVPLIFFFSCQDLTWEIASLLAANNAASLRSEVSTDPATTVVLVTGSTAMTPSTAGGRGQQSSAGSGSLPARLPGLSTQLMTSGCQTLSVFQTDERNKSHSGSP